MDRRVKIVTTLGPAVNDPARLRELISVGADMVRINAAHGQGDVRVKLVKDVREAAAAVGKRVPILLDLQGLKIRTGPLPAGAPSTGVGFARGNSVRLSPSPVPTTPEEIGVTYTNLLQVVTPGSRVLIADGLIELLIESVHDDHAAAKVSRGGQLVGKQGVTLPGAPITGGALTEADREDVRFAVEHGLEYLGLSFISDASDLTLTRDVARSFAGKGRIPGIISKIERPQALENLQAIAAASDGLMVARGDLGVQLPPERVPKAQKLIISTANRLGIPVITATQMLESMIHQPVATRAETSDVANAVWDGTDAVMLSAESAMGQYPFEAVATMDRIIREVEDGPTVRSAASQEVPHFEDPGRSFADAVARAAFQLSNDTPAKHVIVFSKSGAAVRQVARYRPGPPIIAAVDTEEVARSINLVWGVQSVVVPVRQDPDELFRHTGKLILDQGLADLGDYALIVGSLPMTNVSGQTNMIHFRRIGE